MNIFADVTKGHPKIITSGGNGNKGQDGQDGKRGVDREGKVWQFRNLVVGNSIHQHSAALTELTSKRSL